MSNLQKEVQDHINSYNKLSLIELENLKSKMILPNGEIKLNTKLNVILTDKIIPLVLRCIQTISNDFNNDKKCKIQLVLKGGTMAVKYSETPVDNINDIDIVIIPKKIKVKNIKNKNEPHTYISETSKFIDHHSKYSIIKLINSIYAMCMYLNTESIYFADDLKSTGLKHGYIFKVRPWLIKSNNIFLFSIDIIDDLNNTNYNIVDFVLGDANTYISNNETSRFSAQKIKYLFNSLVNDSGITVINRDYYINDIIRMLKTNYSQPNTKIQKRFIRVLTSKISNLKGTNVNKNQFQLIINKYEPKFKFNIDLNNFIKKVGFCVLLYYSNVKKTQTDYLEYIESLMETNNSHIEHNNFVCLAKSANVFNGKQYKCMIGNKNKLIKFDNCANNINRLFDNHIKKYNIFNILIRYGLDTKTKNSWYNIINKSNIQPFLIGGKGILKLVSTYIKPTILKSYLYDTVDYDIHIGVNDIKYIDKSKKIIDHFIKDFTKKYKYSIKYSNFKMYPDSKVGYDKRYKKYAALTYIIVDKYNSNNKVVLDITFTSEINNDIYDKKSTIKHKIPIKTPNYYKNNLIKQLKSHFYKKKLDNYKFKKLIIRAYYLDEISKPSKLSIFYKPYKITTNYHKMFWSVLNQDNYIKDIYFKKYIKKYKM